MTRDYFARLSRFFARRIAEPTVYLHCTSTWDAADDAMTTLESAGGEVRVVDHALAPDKFLLSRPIEP